MKGTHGPRKATRIITEGFNVYRQSGELEEYNSNFVVTRIDGRDNSVSFANGKRIFAGDVLGEVSEEQLRRIQIRETILSHLECERTLFSRGIKVLSLFFIDEVANYKQYNAAGQAVKFVQSGIIDDISQNIDVMRVTPEGEDKGALI